MANFNGYDDVRSWLASRSVTELRESVDKGDFRGKTLSVARAYLEDVDAAASDQPAPNEKHGLVWRGWQIAATVGVLVVPALLVWAIKLFKS
jgi:hypothetical protein